MRAGQTAHLHARLRKDATYAYVCVFSAVGDVEPSPHVPAAKLGILQKGRPVMAQPTTMRLTRELRPKHRIELVADEDCTLYLMQEVDTAADTLARGRISTHVPRLNALFVQAFGWLRRSL